MIFTQEGMPYAIGFKTNVDQEWRSYVKSINSYPSRVRMQKAPCYLGCRHIHLKFLFLKKVVFYSLIPIY